MALCALLLRQPDLLLSTNRPTISTRRACSGSNSTSRSIRDVVAITPRPVLLTTSRSGSWRMDRGRCFPYEGNYSTCLETKASRLKVEGAKRREDAQAPH